MSGTVLSTLCSICHTEPPKYKCPRCGVRTCSVPCIKKHKARADCDGVRNPRAFLPLKQLKTPAGIDHDYNFLTSIERARERAEKEVLEARRLLSERDLRPKNEDKVFQKVWDGDELRHVPVQSQLHKKSEGPVFIDGFDKHVRRRLRYLDIEAITMPKGMARQRENKTAWNRRTQSINWQVEWLVYRASELGFPAPQADQQPLRILCKTLEGTALHSGLASALDWHRGQLDRQSRLQPDPAETENETDSDDAPPIPKKRKIHHNNQNRPLLPALTQDPSTSTWSAPPYALQYFPTTAWSQTTTSPHTEITLEEKLTAWDFYLVKAVPHPVAGWTTNTDDKGEETQQKKTGHKTIIPLASSSESLTTALTGRSVLEFPTVMAVPRGCGLPAGYAVGGAGERRTNRCRRAVGPAVSEHKEAANIAVDAEGAGDAEEGEASAFRRCQGVKRSRQCGGSADGVRGSRGGKRFRPGLRRTPAALARGKAVERQIQHQQQLDDKNDAEEGEVSSDGDEVMGEVANDSGLAGEMGNANREGDRSRMTLGRMEEEELGKYQEEQHGAGNSRGGLVDYGSSDESD
ncbi:hypothetical protein C7999DRAFT_14982 [Corynascus novoguineensis]|uniref:Box C/D snoRNA protein 1 n=1 Tax=Corynascus novoguineensis TaxID=1126955 RepID=A0AAN7CS54_9PEZI|nr:hypothetical protein C7999DRAFT_14982 [Corynascus novoguineensis]